jgi:hypothetical protein
MLNSIGVNVVTSSSDFGATKSRLISSLSGVRIQKAAARLLGTDQPRISALLHGRLEGFSSDRLFRSLNALDQDVEIVIREAKKKNRQVPGIRVLTPT